MSFHGLRDTFASHLVTAMHEILPTPVPAIDLRRLVDSMRGHMHQLGWAEPWLFRDVIFLLQDDRANTDDACQIWLQELIEWLGTGHKAQPRLFVRQREGQTTAIAAFLFAASSSERQQAGLKAMQAILKQQGRTVRQPLASTSDWTLWDDALKVAMWILAFARWGQYYMRQRALTDHGLEELALSAREIAMIRPIDEWRSQVPVGRANWLHSLIRPKTC